MSDGNCFFALYPPAGVRSQLARVARENARSGRPVRAGQLHMTLAFLGPRDAAALEAARAAAEGLEASAFDLYLDQLGYFYRKRILWQGASEVPPGLTWLATELRRRLLEALATPEGKPDRVLAGVPPFVPHITLARRVSPHTLPRIRPVHWPVRRFFLMQSVPEGGGHVYHFLNEWQLAPDGDATSEVPENH